MPLESPSNPNLGKEFLPAKQAEQAKLQEKVQVSLNDLKEQVGEQIADGKYMDAVKSVGKTVEKVLTDMGGNLQKIVAFLKAANGGQAPGWLQMALEYYAGHYKTKLTAMGKIMGVPFDAEKEMAQGTNVESLMRTLETTAKARHPDAKDPLEALATELKGKTILTVQELVVQAGKLPPRTPPAAPATTPNAQPAAAPTATPPATPQTPSTTTPPKPA